MSGETPSSEKRQQKLKHIAHHRPGIHSKIERGEETNEGHGSFTMYGLHPPTETAERTEGNDEVAPERSEREIAKESAMRPSVTSEKVNDESNSKASPSKPGQTENTIAATEPEKALGSTCQQRNLSKLQTKDAETTVQNSELRAEGVDHQKPLSTTPTNFALQQLGKEISVLEAQKFQLEVINSEQEAELKALMEDKKTISSTLEDVKTEWIKSCKEDRDNALPDDFVRGEFADFEGRCKSWMNIYAARHLDERKEVGLMLQGMLAEESNSKTWAAPELFNEAQKDNITVRAALMASMTHLVFRGVMDDPFHHHQGEQTEISDTMKMIGPVDEAGRLVGEEKAILWRSLTLQILNSIGGERAGNVRGIGRRITSKSKKKATTTNQIRERARTERFQREADLIQSKCAVLLKPLDTSDESSRQRNNHLVDIIRRLSNLCSLVYAQNVRIMVLASEVDFARVRGTHLCARSEVLSPHPGMRIGEEDYRCKGAHSCHIGCITQPAVVAYHKKRSSDDRECSVYLQGVGWGWMQKKTAKNALDPQDTKAPLGKDGAVCKTAGSTNRTVSRHIIPVSDDEESMATEEATMSKTSDSQASLDLGDNGGSNFRHENAEDKSIGTNPASTGNTSEFDEHAEMGSPRDNSGRSLSSMPSQAMTKVPDIQNCDSLGRRRARSEDTDARKRPSKRAKVVSETGSTCSRASSEILDDLSVIMEKAAERS